MQLPGSTVPIDDVWLQQSSLPVGEAVEDDAEEYEMQRRGRLHATIVKTCSASEQGEDQSCRCGQHSVCGSHGGFTAHATRIAWPLPAPFDEHLLMTRCSSNDDPRSAPTPGSTPSTCLPPTSSSPQKDSKDPGLAAYLSHVQLQRAAVRSAAMLETAKTEQIRHAANCEAAIRCSKP
uniref:Uncharacterized protein n=1 Tax=Dunaliella tertiolecta TaxID=3047 RepID=A0A7S3R9G6_DUNTE|eukprot:1141432-Pelagomonas_calceolata.AAC.7